MIVDRIAAAAARWGVPVEIAVAVARRESNLNQNARGAAGEVGTFQLMPGTAADLGVDPYDLDQNVEGGVRYLREQFDRFGDWATALMAYNGGPGNVQRGTVSSAARRYAGAVLDAAGGAIGPVPAPLALPRLIPEGLSVAAPSLGVTGILGLSLAGLALWALLRR